MDPKEMESGRGLERYRAVVGDWDDFARVARSPEPTTLRVRRRHEGTSPVETLRGAGFGLDPVPGLPDFFRVTREPFPVSKTLEHWLGDFYIQQASTGVAAPALGARSGERILDLCAAPGGKTTHLADQMGDTGIVVASDSDGNRIRALLANVYRLLHPNVLAVECDGRSFPGGARFDRVLVDVPCSGEGNVRRHGGEIRRRSDSFTEHITGIQRALLRRALELVRPGGVVLYTTCTFAPEENEAVVDDVLSRGGGALVPIELDVPHAPGLTSFEGRSYRDDLALAWRIYPHHLDSGGLFLARIRRDPDRAVEPGSEVRLGVGASGDAPGTTSTVGAGWTAVPRRFPGGGTDAGGREEASDSARGDPGGAAPRRIRRGTEGVSRSFELAGGDSDPVDALRWIERGNSLWAHACSSWPVESWDPEGDWRVLSLGIRGLKRDPRTSWSERPTSDLLRMMEGRLRRRILDLGEEEVLEVLNREPRPVPSVDRGFVALRFRGRVLGRGWVKDETLVNEIAKARSQRLRADLTSARTEEGSGEQESC